ncbi:hypothetical protein GN956_G5301 [Arapaima gigas]
MGLKKNENIGVENREEKTGHGERKSSDCQMKSATSVTERWVSGAGSPRCQPVGLAGVQRGQGRAERLSFSHFLSCVY